jgi:outer membrane protein assembly factor BamB
VVFAASRNTTNTNCGTSATNNKLFALRGDTGASLWTFNDTCTYSIDYIVGMPYVDYARNRVYLATRGTGSTLWILSTLDGAIVQQLDLGNLDTSPALSADGATIYVGSAGGRIYAVDATTFTTNNYDLLSAIKSVIWEDWLTPGRLYFTTADGNLWGLQHDGGASFTQLWKVPVAGASTPLLLDNLYVGSSDGRLHEFDLDGGNEKVFPASGTLDGTTVGDVSTEDGTHVFVGTNGGKLFKIQVPLP